MHSAARRTQGSTHDSIQKVMTTRAIAIAIAMNIGACESARSRVSFMMTPIPLRKH